MKTKSLYFCVVLMTVMAIVACDDSSSGAGPEPVAEVSSSSDGEHAISSSSVTDKGTSSGGSSKSSSSVKSGDDSQKSSSSSGKKNNSSSSEGGDYSSSGTNDNRSSSSGYVLRDSLCSSDYEGWTQYIPQLQQEFICENGRWIPMSSSSVTPSSSSKYYDMSRLFVNDKGYSYGEFTDPRDGQVYKTIRYEVSYGYYGLDSITFFAQNLNYGKMIPSGTQMVDSTKFCYDDDPWYCDNGFGGLYTWATVMNFPAACDSFAMGSAKCPVEYNLMSNPIPEFQNKLYFVLHQGICPEGWHVMNQEEWGMVMEGTVIMDGASYLGAVLWGSNQRGFSLLPAGKLLSQMPYSSESLVMYEELEKYAYHWLPGEYESDENDGILGLVAIV
ncbi:hypothetical protein IKQ19_20150, partial [Candidatus Saccharibacteria bacterium]|nr:hypothetical protein [Candidatus Saccharibacteria bacterium]